MLTVNKQQNKLSAAQSIFTQAGMMQGTTLVYTTMVLRGDCPLPLPIIEDDLQDDHGALIGRTSDEYHHSCCNNQYAIQFELMVYLNSNVVSIRKELP